MKNSKAHPPYILQKPLYDNCQLLDSKGTLLSTCNRKKVQWYVDKGLGSIIKENPVTLRLNFSTNYKDQGCPSKVYYCHDKDNICVVCGCSNLLLRKYIVPAEYRKYLGGTSHSSHDILLFCKSCHDELNKYQHELKKSLCTKYKVPINNAETGPKFLPNEDIKKVQQAGKALKKHRSTLPDFRIKEFSDRIKNFYNIEILTDEDIDKASKEIYMETNDHYESHGKQLMEAYKNFNCDDMLASKKFEKLWRQHFLDNMKPKHLPLDWSVDHGFDLVLCEEPS